MSFLDNTEWGDGHAALENLVSFGTEPLMRALMLLLDQGILANSDRGEVEFALTVLQEKIEDMEKNIKRFMAELKPAETASEVGEGGAA